MDYTLILNNISKHISLDELEKEYFISLLEYQKVKARTKILDDGEVSRYSNFVISGCFRGFTVDKNGTEHVLSFAPTDWWISDIYSLITQNPGALNIESLEETEFFRLSKTNQELLYARVPKFERFFRIIIEKFLVSNQQRLIDNMSLTAEERYQNFCKRYPSLINKLPQKQIAAYLGVTPEFMSRMRSQLLRKL